MPRPKDTSYDGDPEYAKFEQMISDSKLCPATAKTDKASRTVKSETFSKSRFGTPPKILLGRPFG